MRYYNTGLLKEAEVWQYDARGKGAIGNRQEAGAVRLDYTGYARSLSDGILGGAVREYPTGTGPMDYALFVDGKPVSVVEAPITPTRSAARMMCFPSTVPRPYAICWRSTSTHPLSANGRVRLCKWRSARARPLPPSPPPIGVVLQYRQTAGCCCRNRIGPVRL